MGQSGTSTGVVLTVRETLGLRRFGYPVTVELPIPSGTVREVAGVGLEQGGQPVRGVQVDPMHRWPDGSLRWVRLCFNLSPAPLETASLQVRLGAGVQRTTPGSGIVRETAESFVIRDVYHLGRSGSSFLSSVRYGQREFLAGPARWYWQERPEAPQQPLEIEQGRLVTGGPVNAIVELTGRVSGSGTPFRLTVAQPNSKSWFDAALELRRPGSGEGRLGFSVPYVVERRPALYDFGAGSWIYGQLREGGRATLRIEPGGRWKLFAPPATAATPVQEYAAAGPRQAKAEGWAHLIDGAQAGRAIGFGSPSFLEARRPYTGEIWVGADGATGMHWNADGRSKLTVRALFHHVNDPIHVSAATSPPAMLYPLAVKIPPEWYQRCATGQQPAE